MSGTILEKKMSKRSSKMKKNNDFEAYLQTRRENTTYNGIELETTDWNRELFGFKTDK